MTAYALARIFSKLFGEVDFAAINIDRNKYPIGMVITDIDYDVIYFFSCFGLDRVVFTSIRSYLSAITVSFRRGTVTGRLVCFLFVRRITSLSIANGSRRLKIANSDEIHKNMSR